MNLAKDIRRFESKLGPVLESGCIEWQAACNPDTQYGIVWFQNRLQSAHRVAYFIEHGHIPTGEIVLHKCDNRKCVNPKHLLAGSYGENLDDRWERGRSNIGANHGMAKLTDEKVLAMRELRSEGIPLKVIAIEFGVSYSTAVSATNGSRWKHLNKELTD